jgi:tetratricopeptide (TPR) repeat protein
LFFLLPEAAPRVHLAALGRRVDAVVSCGPAAGFVTADAAGRYAPVFPGWGHYHYAISTTIDSAQYYFDQGLSLYYGYHLTESLASFKEAALQDSNCVMIYWGQALAMGPYYNSIFSYKMPPEVLPVLTRMNILAAEAGAREKDLAAVMNRRYSPDTTDSRRAVLDRDYSEGMRGLIGKYPDDKDIKALYVDGVMTEHAWDLWDTKGLPKPWTPELIKDCKEILAADPYHPAALHYHIHLLEASLHPEETLASAEKLKVLMPGVAHMVHMASHSYQRSGLYSKGVSSNDSANAAQERYSVLAPQLHLTTNVFHFYAVEAFCAMTGGMYEKAMAAARHGEAAILSRPGVPKTYSQYLVMIPAIVEVRMGKWQAILDRPEPDRGWVYASLLSDFARGMAFIRTGKLDSARRCLERLKVEMRDSSLVARQGPANAPVESAQIAEGILEGELCFAEVGQPPKAEGAAAVRRAAAMVAFDRAMAHEDAMSYVEPKDWLLPVRQFAGVCLLRLGRAAEAEKLYREDLVQNPGNGWALLGLSQSLAAQRKYAAGEYMDQARKAFANAEVMPTASAY